MSYTFVSSLGLYGSSQVNPIVDELSALIIYGYKFKVTSEKVNLAGTPELVIERHSKKKRVPQ